MRVGAVADASLLITGERRAADLKVDACKCA